MSSPSEQSPQKPTQDEPPAKEPPQDQPPAKQYATRHRLPEYVESEGSDEERIAAEERDEHDEHRSVGKRQR
jgi:hypothetical protein